MLTAWDFAALRPVQNHAPAASRPTMSVGNLRENIYLAFFNQECDGNVNLNRGGNIIVGTNRWEKL